jgi:hypothetical protein
VPQLVHARRGARRNTLRQLYEAANLGPVRHGVLHSVSPDANDANTWVLWATVVLAITEVSNPRLQCRRVVLLDNSAVGLNGSLAGDGRPLAGVGDEANVDRGVFFEVVGLARLGVGVEEEVEAVSFLFLVNRPFFACNRFRSSPWRPVPCILMLAGRCPRHVWSRGRTWCCR